MFNILNAKSEVIDQARSQNEAMNVVTYYFRTQPQNGPFHAVPVS